MAPIGRVIFGVQIRGEARVACLTDPRDPTRHDRGHVLLVGDGPEACVIKLVPAAFSRHAEQEQRALRALETIRPALLAVPRLAPLRACLELDSACWARVTLRYIAGDSIIGTPPEVMVETFFP